jgi:hypothetical protein
MEPAVSLRDAAPRRPGGIEYQRTRWGRGRQDKSWRRGLGLLRRWMLSLTGEEAEMELQGPD